MSDTQTIHQRMVAIIGELPAIGKDQKNEQQGFMFRGHDDVLNALNPLLSKHGVFIVPDVLERITDHRATRGGSVMFEVNLHVRFTFFGAAGDCVYASTWGEGTDMGDKATNKAMTMAFKNVLNQAFAISNKETSDADHDTPEETVQKINEKKPQTTKTSSQRKTEFRDPTADTRTDEQATELQAIVARLVAQGSFTEQGFINAAITSGATGSTVDEVLSSVTKGAASGLLERLRKFERNAGGGS